MTAEYFAVPDPADPTRVTYWRRSADTRLHAWPAKARYGPRLLRSDVPDDLKGRERQDWIWAWSRGHITPWLLAVGDAINADPDGCAGRFAALTRCCCWCGRKLTDAASKTYGIGPECRAGLPDEALAALIEAVGRAHAESEAAA
jgi:hypothetical protein